MVESATPLLATKLYVPRRRAGAVSRPRLSERLDRGARAKLTLISAPPGFGKSTLLAEWLAAAPAGEHNVAWLSLDQSDNHVTTFWSYVVSALQTIESQVGADALALLRSPQPPPIQTILALLLNDLGGGSSDLVLVLDDYHVIGTRDIHDGLTFLLDHLPPRLHLVIATRADPELPLSRLRARGELVEIRAADLRFTSDEAAAYFNETMQLDLAPRDVELLEGRTEGWVAALQLAALSMQGRADVADFIASFAGDDRYIVDYLVEEVLQRQPSTVRDFLLQTAVLERLSGSLCDAVTGQTGSTVMLETLERGNLFVVPLDDRRRWYRYHHLFADVLRARLLHERPDQAPELHRRASAWYERNGEPSEAIRHALAGTDFLKAAELVERALPALRRNRQEATLHGWLAALPDELLRSRPMLSNMYAGVLLTSGDLKGVDARLRDAERSLETPNEMVVLDPVDVCRLPGSIALHRAGFALASGNLAETVVHARRALDLAPDDDHLGRGGAAGILGIAAWASGDLESAYRSWSAGMASLQKAGHIADAMGAAIAVADIRIAQGQLHDALRTYERALQLASEHGPPVLRGTPDMHVGISGIHRERNDLQAAERHLLRSQELGEHNGLPQNPYRWRVAMARVQQARGDLDGALDLLCEAQRVYVGDLFPNVRPVAALKARALLAKGSVHEAIDWAREQGLSVDDDLSYMREFEHITLARLLLARGSSLDAARFLDRLLTAAEEGKRTGTVIEILVLQALAQQAQGDSAAALDRLTRALSLAEPAGYVRMFVDEGPAMLALLHTAAKHGIAADYVRQLLVEFGQAVGQAQESAPAQQALTEPLSERELEVLRLLGTELDGPDIARELTVSLNTLRTHTKNIYAKLGVNNRRAAVRRAAELALS